MDAPFVDNKTDFAASPRLLLGKEGERLVVIVKATFEKRVGAAEIDLVPRKDRRGVRGADIPWGDPEKSAIKYPSDLCIIKPGTDVIVVASAHAPFGKPVPSFDAAIRLGPLSKTVRIFGLRVWGSGGASLSAPRPTAGVEIRYDLAFGGIDTTDPERPLEEPRNPAGTGVARDPATLTHKPAPMIEDPESLLTSAKMRPPPAGLGAIGRHFEPRRGYLGTYDAAWLEERAPLLPLDHDDRSNLCASPGLTATPHLRGGEPVSLTNLTPAGACAFLLPKIRLRITHHTPGRDPESKAPPLDTVLLDTIRVSEGAEATIELVWRASFHPPRRMKDARIVVTEEEPS